MCFADDLIILCKPKIDSLQLMKVMLDHFALFSGLKANMTKSKLYFGGLTGEEELRLTGFLDFERGPKQGMAKLRFLKIVDEAILTPILSFLKLHHKANSWDG
ncbi:hypothetical protein AKJ16_DCAP11387 [Drosera capensis]